MMRLLICLAAGIFCLVFLPVKLMILAGIVLILLGGLLFLVFHLGVQDFQGY